MVILATSRCGVVSDIESYHFLHMTIELTSFIDIMQQYVSAISPYISRRMFPDISGYF